jgi:hypothetical protein
MAEGGLTLGDATRGLRFREKSMEKEGEICDWTGDSVS